jgi:hypothetical protein
MYPLAQHHTPHHIQHHTTPTRTQRGGGGTPPPAHALLERRLHPLLLARIRIAFQRPAGPGAWRARRRGRPRRDHSGTGLLLAAFFGGGERWWWTVVGEEIGAKKRAIRSPSLFERSRQNQTPNPNRTELMVDRRTVGPLPRSIQGRRRPRERGLLAWSASEKITQTTTKMVLMMR